MDCETVIRRRLAIIVILSAVAIWVSTVSPGYHPLVVWSEDWMKYN
jgi:hypothetical protein